jgi:hypothetical protein
MKTRVNGIALATPGFAEVNVHADAPMHVAQ